MHATMQEQRQETALPRPRVYVPRRAHHDEELVRLLLLRVEELYERLGMVFVLAHPRRRRWEFVRVLGATRIAGELRLHREDVVVARRKAFFRWRYWFFRYEAPLWHEIMQLDPMQWEHNYVEYRKVRAQLRKGTHPHGRSELVALALRSLQTTTWHEGGEAEHWHAVWRLFQRGQEHKASALAAELGWSAVHLRRTKRAVGRLQSLARLPLTQRQLLALSSWPEAHLRALRLSGRALFATQSVTIDELTGLRPQAIAVLPLNGKGDNRGAVEF